MNWIQRMVTIKPPQPCRSDDRPRLLLQMARKWGQVLQSYTSTNRSIVCGAIAVLRLHDIGPGGAPRQSHHPRLISTSTVFLPTSVGNGSPSSTKALMQASMASMMFNLVAALSLP